MENSVKTEIVGRVSSDLYRLIEAGKTVTDRQVEELVRQHAGLITVFNEISLSENDCKIITQQVMENFSVLIEDVTELVNNDGHEDWLSSKQQEINWAYWERYRTYIARQIGPAPLSQLDEVTDRILSHLESPERKGVWDRRGLVVGHVQSGKTSNYTGLISKAADAGYKVIIVLAGLHKNLRSQTQIRLEEGFLGYDTNILGGGGKKLVGVGKINPSLLTDSITGREDNGDFSKVRAKHFAINPGGNPLLFVIKKQKTVLNNLIDWVAWTANQDSMTGARSLPNVPLLMIDDEADHASVDTKDHVENEDGSIDLEHDPSVINSLIRRLLTLFQQKAYVGYTATPFANIFIHEKAETLKEGPDLFPSSFIMNLPAPSNYFGPNQVFGEEINHDGSTFQNIKKYVRTIEDSFAVSGDETTDWVPPKHKSTHAVLFDGEPIIPPSLRTAIYSFVLSTAVRRYRNNVSDHNSMLVHVSRFTLVQSQVSAQIHAEVMSLKREFRYGELDGEVSRLEEIRQLFRSDYINYLNQANDKNRPLSEWSQLEKEVRAAVDLIQIREINGSAGDILDYSERSNQGLVVIAVGGDKLSRGLTLEGLTVSYFLRASRMYDTLMQMGRWFGYRLGYEDVCRIFIPSELSEWFQKITDASEELREEFDHMAAIRATPRNYGLRVQTHPSLMITSKVKMRSGTKIKISYAGTISETVVFHREANYINDNYQTTEQLLQAIGTPNEINPNRFRPPKENIQNWKDAYVWNDVSANLVTSFFSHYATHEDSVKVNSSYISKYIEHQNSQGTLMNWDIVFISGESEKHKIKGFDIRLATRAPSQRSMSIRDQKDANKYSIGRLANPRDETIMLTDEQYSDALKITQTAWKKAYEKGTRKSSAPPTIPGGPASRCVRDTSKGLLLLYALDPNNEITDPKGKPVIGFAVSFPANSDDKTIEYAVNNVYRQAEFDFVS